MSVTILAGDCRERLRELAAGSVHCIVSSPPYWSLRDYGLPPLIWGDGECSHEWETALGKTQDTPTAFAGRFGDGNGQGRIEKPSERITTTTGGQFCRLCNAWRGSLGLEPEPSLFVQHLVEVMREVRRVLRDDGTVWLNLGDSYSGSGAGGGGNRKGNEHGQHDAMVEVGRPGVTNGLKPKDLIGIPWRVAVGARGLASGTVEVKRRDSDQRQQVPLGEIVAFLRRAVEEATEPTA